jgi:hypothetical protein
VVIIYCDGSWRPCIPAAGVGVSAQRDGWEIATISERVGSKSSTSAEIAAAQAAVWLAQREGYDCVTLRSDSMTVVERSEHLAAMLRAPLVVEHVPRKRNWRAHQLAAMAVNPRQQCSPLIVEYPIGTYSTFRDVLKGRTPRPRSRRLPKKVKPPPAPSFDSSEIALASAQDIIEEHFAWHCAHGAHGLCVTDDEYLILCWCNELLKLRRDLIK